MQKSTVQNPDKPAAKAGRPSTHEIVHRSNAADAKPKARSKR
jgi:hypothetical protein